MVFVLTFSNSIAVVVNPLHLIDDAPSAASRLGPERSTRAGRAFPLRTMSEASVRLSFASDWPVAALDPLAAVHAASFRRPGGHQRNVSSLESDQTSGSGVDTGGGDGAGGFDDWPWVPLEAVSLEAALTAHTSGAASALMLRDYVGALEVGMRADFVVLDRSPLVETSWGKGAPSVIATFVDGVCAHGCRLGAWPWL